jgi:hypothetical protein
MTTRDDGLLLKGLIQFLVVALSFISAYAFLPVNEFASGWRIVSQSR